MASHMTDRDPENASTPDPPAAPAAVIDIRGPDERSAQLQLAARWAERYAPPVGDTERAARKRFRLTHDYVDDVIHGIEPHPPR